jgi:hypothetical protein
MKVKSLNLSSQLSVIWALKKCKVRLKPKPQLQSRKRHVQVRLKRTKLPLNNQSTKNPNLLKYQPKRKTETHAKSKHQPTINSNPSLKTRKGRTKKKTTMRKSIKPTHKTRRTNNAIPGMMLHLIFPMLWVLLKPRWGKLWDISNKMICVSGEEWRLANRIVQDKPKVSKRTTKLLSTKLIQRMNSSTTPMRSRASFKPNRRNMRRIIA